jgi:hypothetical protein
MSFARFMASTARRAIRAIAGLVLVAVGLSLGGAGGIVVGDRRCHRASNLLALKGSK